MTGKELKAWRRYRNLSRGDIAQYISEDIGSVRWWEGEDVFGTGAGYQPIPGEFLEELSEVLNVPLDLLENGPTEEALLLVQPECAISTEDHGSFENTPGRIVRIGQPSTISLPGRRICVELGESMEAVEGGKWKRVCVRVEIPSSEGEWETCVHLAQQEAKRVLSEELQRTYAEMAAQFNEPLDLQRK